MSEQGNVQVLCDSNLITEGNTAIFQKGEILKAAKITQNKQVCFERLRFKVGSVIGDPYGSSYKVEKHLLNHVVEDDIFSQTQKTNAVTDNRNLIGGQQTMDRDDIIKLKEAGASGTQIVESLVKSSSFAQKTVFSQNKYLQKKKKKYSSIVKILKPSARLVCKLYEGRDPQKICHMEASSLSQLLNLSNLKTGSKVVLVETCSGVVLGSVLERLGGTGSVVNLHAGGETAPNLFAVSNLNFADSFWQTCHSLPLHKLSPVLECTDEKMLEVLKLTEEEEDNEPGEDGEDAVVQVDKVEENKPPTRKRKFGKHPELTREEKLAIRTDRRQQRKEHQLEAVKLLRAKNMDCLIVACRMHPTPIVKMLMETLAPSRPFVVYCEHRQPLMELFVDLSVSGQAINLHLADTFMRYYQVLPERTHPMVNKKGSGGYVLSGIKVIPE